MKNSELISCESIHWFLFFLSHFQCYSSTLFLLHQLNKQFITWNPIDNIIHDQLSCGLRCFSDFHWKLNYLRLVYVKMLGYNSITSTLNIVFISQWMFLFVSACAPYKLFFYTISKLKNIYYMRIVKLIINSNRIRWQFLHFYFLYVYYYKL